MTRIYIMPNDDSGEGFYRRIYELMKRDRGAWASRGAKFGLAGGMLSFVLAALLWASVLLQEQGEFASFLRVLETVFFVMALPLLALGAYCLDLLEKRLPILTLPTKPLPTGFKGLHRLRPTRPHQN